MHEIEKAVIDTNVIIYDVFEDSLYHKEASSILNLLEIWIIPTIVIHEFIWFLKGLGLGIKESYEIILQYINNEKSIIKPISSYHIREALNTILVENTSLSKYNDKLILTTAIEEKTPIATFDKKLRSQAKRLGVRVIPETMP